MPHFLERYLLRRWLVPIAGSLLFFGGLILANEVVAQSRDIFRQGASFRWLFPLLATSIPEVLGMVLPMAAVLGGLLGTHHLVQGSELVACQGLGVGQRALLRPFAVLGVLLVAASAFNAHFVVPVVARAQTNLRGRMLEEARTRFLRPGAPPWVPPSAPGTAMWVAPGGQLHLMEVSENSVQHLVASHVNWSVIDKDISYTSLIVDLSGIQGALHHKADGRQVQILQDSQRMEFRIPSAMRIFPPTPTRYRDTSRLFRSEESGARVELARRFSLPIAAAALLLLGIALGMGHPRFQRSGALSKGLAVILTYYLLLKLIENQISFGKMKSVIPLYVLPWAALLLGALYLLHKLKPHRGFPLRKFVSARVRRFLKETSSRPLRLALIAWKRLRTRIPVWRHRETSRSILAGWSSTLWWKAWGGTLATLLVLSLMVEFANLAGEIVKYSVPMHIFLRYWLWNLPPFLAVALPIAFLLGGVFAFSETAASREWVALRAGGVSLFRWVGTAWRSWATVLLLGLLVPAGIAPKAFTIADNYYRQILNRPARISRSTPWLHLGSTGVLWYLDGAQRWGFPLHAPGIAPVLLKWDLGARASAALPWGGLAFLEGPTADQLFPERSLQRAATAEESSTLDLFQWQKWAPDPERSSLLWTRLLNWLAGPVLLFGALSFSFPSPRSGRGQAMGAALILGLAYLGLQALFGGAAKAGEIPAVWGVVGPLLIILGFGFLRLRALKT